MLIGRRKVVLRSDPFFEAERCSETHFLDLIKIFDFKCYIFRSYISKNITFFCNIEPIQ